MPRLSRRLMQAFRRALTLYAVVTMTIVGDVALADNALAEGSTYEIRKPSNFARGCYDGCACPITSSPMEGTYRLVFDRVDPLYTNYRVEEFDAVVTQPGSSQRLQGSGTYRIGGEVALMHQMTLDLRTTEGVPYHFDSGLVPGGGLFPAITISLAANGFACFDSVLNVHSESPSAGVTDPRTPGAAQAVPNPFQVSTELRFVQREEGQVDVSVFDTRGRLVRRLLPAEWHTGGFRTLAWDGRLDGGALAPAGLYVARVRAPGQESFWRIVKLE